MSKMSYVKKAIITAVCIALCIVLPMAFHAIPGGGRVFSPMHIPVLLCGLICGMPFGVLCGIAGPLLSSLITNMPPMAVLPPMLIELAVYGLVAGLLMRFVKTKYLAADLYISLSVSMLAGRIIAGLAKALIFSPGEFSFAMWTASYFVNALPGIILHLIAVPLVYFALVKARLIPERYPKINGAE